MIWRRKIELWPSSLISAETWCCVCFTSKSADCFSPCLRLFFPPEVRKRTEILVFLTWNLNVVAIAAESIKRNTCKLWEEVCQDWHRIERGPCFWVCFWSQRVCAVGFGKELVIGAAHPAPMVPQASVKPVEVLKRCQTMVSADVGS